MKKILRTHVRSHEIGLRFHEGELQRVLGPGTHWRRRGTMDAVYDRTSVRFDDPALEVLVKDTALRALLDVVELADHERAIVFKAGRVHALLAPGLHAFWKQDEPLVIERYDVRDVRFEHSSLEQIIAHPSAKELLRVIRTDEQEDLLVFHGGQLLGHFGPGVHAFWNGAGPVTWKGVDRREQLLDVAGQEIMTSDKVTLRVNLAVTYRVTDPELALSSSNDAAQALYRAAQLALRAVVGQRSLDQLLADKDSATDELVAPLTARAKELGLALVGLGLRDVILPGDMKSILNQVIEAQKQSEANIIRRREETAAARSQANTAKLLAENPVLLRMKELEHVAQILSGSNATLVLGQGEITQQLRSIVTDALRSD